jgi:hypothetical protein
VLAGCDAVLPLEAEAGAVLVVVVSCAGVPEPLAVEVPLDEDPPLDEAVEEDGVVVELVPELPAALDEVPLDVVPLDAVPLEEDWLELGIE